MQIVSSPELYTFFSNQQMISTKPYVNYIWLVYLDSLHPDKCVVYL